MDAGEGAAEAGLIVEVGPHHLHALIAQGHRGVGVRVAGDCAGAEAPGRIGQDRADHAAALSTGRAGHRDDLV